MILFLLKTQGMNNHNIFSGMRDRMFDIHGYMMNVFDTGGQRSERNKWIHCFDTVHCLIYVASLEHFDTNLYEDSDINAMTEQIELFQCLVNGRYCRHSHIVLILNFKDLLKQKIEEQGKSISICFDDYDIDDLKMDGDDDDDEHKSEYKRSLKFVEQKFKSQMPANRTLFALMLHVPLMKKILNKYLVIYHV